MYYVVERGGLWGSATVWWTMWLLPQCGRILVCGSYHSVVDYVVATTVADYVIHTTVWWTMWFIPQCDGQCGSYHSVVEYVVGLPQCDGLGFFYHSVAYYVVDCVFPYHSVADYVFSTTAWWIPMCLSLW